MAKKSTALSPVPGAPMGNDEWEAKDHAETLMKAGEIMADPHKMKAASKHLKKKKKAMRSVEDLKAFHQAKYGKPGSVDEENAEAKAGVVDKEAGE